MFAYTTAIYLGKNTKMCYKKAYFAKCDLIRDVITWRYSNKDVYQGKNKNQWRHHV